MKNEVGKFQQAGEQILDYYNAQFRQSLSVGYDARIKHFCSLPLRTIQHLHLSTLKTTVGIGFACAL